MNPQDTNQTLDPQVVNMAKAIRQTESGGNPNAQGASGEYGAYQFMPNTWASDSQKYLGSQVPLQQATLEQQNEVAYKKIAALKSQGYNVGQVASIWNSGKPDWQGNVGTNSKGVHYDTPSYVNKVAQNYQQLKSATPTFNPKPFSSGEAALPTNENAAPTTPDSSSSGGVLNSIWNGAKNVANWAFPIVKDVANDVQGQNQKSVLQQLGDAGLSALWFVPGLGEGAGLAAHILQGAGVGYGAGVLSSLSQGKDIMSSITPNTSNLLGAATGGVAGGVLSKLSSVLGKNFTQEGALQAVGDNLENALRGTKSGVNFVTDSAAQGFKPAKLLAQSMAIPDIVDGKFDTSAAQGVINNRINQLGQVRAQALDSLGATVPLQTLRKEALSQVEGLAATGETGPMTAKINKLFDDFQNSYGDSINPTQLEKIKEAQAGASRIYKKNGAIGDQNASSVIGNVARDKIEALAQDAGFPGMKQYNNYIKAHYNALDALDKLNGQVVKGGRLGNIMRGHTIAGISALGANAMGGGFLGTVSSAAAGEMANSLLSKVLGETSFSNPLRDAVLNKIEEENPEIVQKLLQFTGKSRNVASVLSPAKSKINFGLLSSIANKSLIKGATGISSPSIPTLPSLP